MSTSPADIRLVTERLILRPWADGDRPALARILGDAEVRRFYPKTLTVDETNAQIDHAIARAGENGFHLQAAELRETGALIGLIGIGVVPEDVAALIGGERPVEIGWQFDKAVWGQGLAPEGARAWLDYAWDVLDLPEVVAFTAAINAPSQRVMEKIGMRRAPRRDFEHPRLAPGHPLRSHVVYEIANPRRRQAGRH